MDSAALSLQRVFQRIAAFSGKLVRGDTDLVPQQGIARALQQLLENQAAIDQDGHGRLQGLALEVPAHIEPVQQYIP